MGLTREHVQAVFSALSKDQGTFFQAVDDACVWNVRGSHPLSGIYQNKADLRASTFA